MHGPRGPLEPPPDFVALGFPAPRATLWQGRLLSVSLAPVARPTPLRGNRLINVAGESHYQDALRSLTGGAAGEPVRRELEASLVPEPENRFDPNAVRVEIGGKLVGYLPREEAAAYGPTLATLERRGRRAACEALVSGRGGANAMIGVFLRMPEPESGPGADDVTRRW